MKRVAKKALIAEITEAEVHVYDRAMTPVRQAPVYHTCITCTQVTRVLFSLYTG